MENKKGSGIFLGVVSVATLVVAIIGATFAYFSASTNSANNAVSVEAYQFAVSMTAEKIAPDDGSLLIPFEPTTVVSDPTYSTNMAYALNVGKGEPCIADGGYQVCALYKVTFTNGVAGSEETLNGKLIARTNTAGTGGSAFSHLKIQRVTFDEESYALSGTEIDVPTNTGDANGVALGTVTAYNAPDAGEGESNVYYYVVWLDEADAANDSEQGAKFEGELVFESANGNQLTGTFTIAG